MSEDHDMIIEIRNDVKHLVSSVGEHIKSDDIVQRDIKKDLQFHQKIVYMGAGILAFLNFVLLFRK